MAKAIRRFLGYWAANFRRSVVGAKQSHTMVVFVIPFVIAVISWFWDLNHNSKAVAAIKWISASGAFAWFLAHAVWVPFSRHEEQQRTIDEQRNAFATEQRRLEAEIQRLADEHTGLTIMWRPNPPCSEGNRCRVEVHNTHRLRASQNVRVQLIAMNPIPRSLRNPVFPINLARVDEDGRTLNPDSNAYFELFFLGVNDETVRRQVIFRDDNGTEQRFDVDDPVEGAVNAFYTLTVRASCAQGHPTEARFESRFPSPARGNEAFQLQPLV